MRYQTAALATGLATVIALAVAVTFVWMSVTGDEDTRRHTAAEAEFAVLRAALESRADGYRQHAVALLQQQEVTGFAVRGGNPPAILGNARISRGGADYLMVSGPGRRLVHEQGLGGSIVNGVSDTADEAVYLLDGAVRGGIFDFAEGPVLARGAATSPGTERASLVLGLLLTPDVLTAMIGDPTRRVSLVWSNDLNPPTGVQILPGTTPGRVSLVAPLELGQARRTLVAVIDAPASALPGPAFEGLSRWMMVLVAIGAAGVVGFGVIVRTMATSVADVRAGLVTAQERDGSPAVLETLAGRDEVGRTAEQAAATLSSLRERTVQAIDEARVATARQLLGEHVIRSMHEGVLVERSDGTCIVCNPAASALLDVEPGQVVGIRNSLRDILGAALYGRLRERARHPEASQRLDVEHVGGRDIAFDAYEVPEYRGDGYSLLVIIRDVSAVLEVEQLKRDVVSVVSHELRTPLTVIALSLGMMDEPGADQSELREAAERNVQRMRELVDDMLDLARLESGQATPSLAAHDPARLCQDVLDFLGPQAQARRVALRLAVDGAIPRSIDVDGRQLQRAVTNLVTNAIKFSPPDTDVWVILRDGGASLFIDVADSGPGVPAEEQERIFTRFYRASNTREQYSGTGLGLPIVRQIAELHRGTAEVLPSERGAYFRITLPVAQTS
jgi:two-component system, NtrC family, sensor histidine kinase KinB